MKLDVVFVLDLSGSVRTSYEMGIRFAQRVVYGLNFRFSGVRIGAVTYSTEARAEFYLDEYGSREAVINALNFHHTGGRTNAAQALSVVRRQLLTAARGDRAGVRNVVVLFSDGNSNVDEWQTLDEARALRADASLYAIALGERPNLREMNDVASKPLSEHMLRVRKLADIDSVADSLLTHFCQ